MGDKLNESYNEMFSYENNWCDDNDFYQNGGNDFRYFNDEEKNLSLKDISTKNENAPIYNETINQTKASSKKNDAIFEKQNKAEPEPEIKNNSKKKMFKTFISHKRKNPDDAQHKWNASDNISDRILVHFDNYLIELGNDVINTNFKLEKNQKHFLKIKYKEHKRNFIMALIKEKKYCDIFKYELSKKNKGYAGLIKEGDTNENTYNFICAKSPLLKKFFDQSYLDLFENYYYKDKRKFDFDGKHFQLSDNTKTFNDLLNKGNGKNRSAENIFINVINNNYLSINRK